MSVSIPQFLVVILALFAGEVAAMTFCFIYQGKVNQEPLFSHSCQHAYSFVYLTFCQQLCWGVLSCTTVCWCACAKYCWPFTLQFVAIPSSGLHRTVASVWHNQICRLLSIIKHFLYCFSFSFLCFLRLVSLLSLCLLQYHHVFLNSCRAEPYFAVSIFHNISIFPDNVTVESGAVGGTYDIYFYK